MQAEGAEVGSGYKLLAYNTSFVNDCDESQFNNNFLSESASIISKIAKLNGKSYDDLINMIKPENGYTQYAELLNKTRDRLSTASTNFIDKRLTDVYDFLALIEQTIHVPIESHANYDPLLINKMDLGEQNREKGILKRISKLNSSVNYSIIDKSVISTSEQSDYKNKYIIVYDNVLNPIGKYGEGIAVVYKQTLVDTPLEWDYKTNPNYMNAIGLTPLADKVEELGKSKQTIDKIHFYSEDLGKYMGADFTKDPDGKVADYGRPFMMTGGIKGDILNLFVAVHAPNIMNLQKIERDSTGKVIKATSLKEVSDDKVVTDIFEAIKNQIQSCIQKGIYAITNKDILSSVSKIQLFLGGDFNDPRGLILEKLFEGLSFFLIMEDSKDPTKSQNITFNYTIKTRDNKRSGKPTNDRLEAGFTKLISGCANTDSLKGNVRKIENLPLGPVGVFPASSDTAGLVKRIQYIQEKYPTDFISPENFGYNGDYALFGSSDTTNQHTYEMQLVNDDYQTVASGEQKVIASDHLPVISVSIIPKDSKWEVKGGRRTRRSRKTRSKKQKGRKSRKMRRR
jgi:hypothetical protein